MATRFRRAPLLLVALASALAALACFALPLYVIRPFRHQGVTELSIALFVTRIAPSLSIICAAVCLGTLLYAWPRLRGWATRACMIFFLLLALLGAWLSRVNIYEHMFHHLDRPQFTSADRANVEPDDMVLTVRVNGIDRAYPIREIAYHHVVNDTVAGEPIVATY